MDDLFDQMYACLQASDTEDVAQLDVISFNLRSVSAELGDLVQEMMIHRAQSIDKDQLSKLLELAQCVTELADFHESRLLRFNQGENWDDQNSLLTLLWYGVGEIAQEIGHSQYCKMSGCGSVVLILKHWWM